MVIPRSTMMTHSRFDVPDNIHLLTGREMLSSFWSPSNMHSFTTVTCQGRPSWVSTSHDGRTEKPPKKFIRNVVLTRARPATPASLAASLALFRPSPSRSEGI